MAELLEYLARQLVDEPDAVRVERVDEGDAVLLAWVTPEFDAQAEAALVELLWRSAPFLSLAHDIGRGGLEAAVAQAALWSGVGAELELPEEAPRGGAAIVACPQDDVGRVGFVHLAELGTVGGDQLLGYSLAELEEAHGS